MKINTQALFIMIVLLVLFLALSLTACSTPSVVLDDSISNTQEMEADIPEPTDAPQPQPTPAEDLRPLDDLEEWDLVWISDSSGWGVAQVYADLVAGDTGKIVNVRDLWIGSLPTGQVLDSLVGTYQGTNFKIEKMPEYIAEAELIVFYGNPMESINDNNPGDWECVPPGPWYVHDCDPENFTVWIEHTKQVFQSILELRAGQPTIIRTYDAYNPLINQFREAGVYEECKQCWAYYNDAFRQAAAEMNIPLAPVAELWNGPDWTIDPDDDLGYTHDHLHPNELGAQVIAQALRELGYDPVMP